MASHRPRRPSLAGGVAARTRRGHTVTEMVAGIEALAATGHRFVLDGEFVAGDGPARRAGESRRQRVEIRCPPAAPVSFWAFDLLWINGDLLIDRPYAERRTELEELPLPSPCRLLPRFPGPDAPDLLVACEDHDVEGIVLKRLTSRYRPGERSRHWRTMCRDGNGRHPHRAQVTLRG
ncbi:MAG: hypothetical protein ACRDFA_03195 [bacterium]